MKFIFKRVDTGEEIELADFGGHTMTTMAVRLGLARFGTVANQFLGDNKAAVSRKHGKGYKKVADVFIREEETK